jgi:hypothetical protein
VAVGADVGAKVVALHVLHLAGQSSEKVAHDRVAQAVGSVTPLHTAVGADVGAVGAEDDVGAADGECDGAAVGDDVGAADGECDGAAVGAVVVAFTNSPARPVASISSSPLTYCATTSVLIEVSSPLEQSGLSLCAR